METEVDWSCLPTVCVGVIFEHLSWQDALVASSTCRNWRAGLGFYNGKKPSLRLVAKESRHRRNVLLTQMFRKNVRSLSIVFECRGKELDKFVRSVLVRFCESRALVNIEFYTIPQFLPLENSLEREPLTGSITAPLLLTHQRSLRRIVLNGCGNLLPVELQIPEDINTFKSLECLAATNIRRRMSQELSHPFPFKGLQSVSMDYSAMDSATMTSLARLPKLRHLALNVYSLRKSEIRELDWSELQTFYDRRVRVTLNLIRLTSGEMSLLMHYVLTPDLPLTVLRVFFCQGMYIALIQTLTELYSRSLRELLYVDPPRVSERDLYDPLRFPDHNDINPLLILCWRCTSLESLVIHGYWIDLYDLKGMVKLRSSTLKRLEVSSLMIDNLSTVVLPTVKTDQSRPEIASDVYKEINELLSFKWKIPDIKHLHPALTAKSTEDYRYSYILKETARDTRKVMR